MDEEHRQRIMRDGPIGLWRTSMGSADVLGVDDLRFNPDGTGLLTTRSALFGTEEVAFLWAVSGYGRIRMQGQYPDDESDPPGEDEKDEGDYWDEIVLEFQRQHTDAGSSDVVVNALQDGFWTLLKPICWVGD